jgi:hypothetical protein
MRRVGKLRNRLTTYVIGSFTTQKAPADPRLGIVRSAPVYAPISPSSSSSHTVAVFHDAVTDNLTGSSMGVLRCSVNAFFANYDLSYSLAGKGTVFDYLYTVHPHVCDAGRIIVWGSGTNRTDHSDEVWDAA